MNQMYEVTYQTPYNQCEWRSQFFQNLDEAKRMVEFYRSCGSPAKLIRNETYGN
jgi:hypothetical protein